jgi:hypothetical protein
LGDGQQAGRWGQGKGSEEPAGSEQLGIAQQGWRPEQSTRAGDQVGIGQEEWECQ